jgi:hypothetical protein
MRGEATSKQDARRRDAPLLAGLGGAAPARRARCSPAQLGSHVQPWASRYSSAATNSLTHRFGTAPRALASRSATSGSPARAISTPSPTPSHSSSGANPVTSSNSGSHGSNTWCSPTTKRRHAGTPRATARSVGLHATPRRGAARPSCRDEGQRQLPAIRPEAQMGATVGNCFSLVSPFSRAAGAERLRHLCAPVAP